MPCLAHHGRISVRTPHKGPSLMKIKWTTLCCYKDLHMNVKCGPSGKVTSRNVNSHIYKEIIYLNNKKGVA